MHNLNNASRMYMCIIFQVARLGEHAPIWLFLVAYGAPKFVFGFLLAKCCIAGFYWAKIGLLSLRLWQYGALQMLGPISFCQCWAP